MLKSDSMMFQIPLIITPNYRIVSKNKGKLGTKTVIMIPINEDEEKQIDSIGRTTLTFHRGNKDFSVQMKDIYCYGEVDFTDENILDEIDNFGFLNYLDEVGIHIRSRYDYITHTCSSPKRYCLWTETWSCAKLAKMAHGYLGKPNRILLFSKFTR